MSKHAFYVTSPIFYPNAKLHIGHAYVMTLCDIAARYHKMIGDPTYFLTGSDENTGKLIKAAGEQGKEVTEYLNEIVRSFYDLYTALNISYDQFIRTTDREKHWPGAIKMWNALVASGDIYKSRYSGLYCLGCETFYTEKDLIDGKCPVHLTVPEKIEEENYFFKLSKYTNLIKEKIESNELQIIPAARKNEIVSLLDRGLEDVSFSRPLKNVPHGIPVPNDPSQVIYVWCDALVNYISALGYGREEQHLFDTFWPASVHIIGKDILRFHAALWPAMLLSAGLALPKAILVHGLIMSGGHKMSKSLGNVIDPYDLITEYGKDSVRYYFAREISPFQDGDLTKEHFKEVYNANLANGIGNLSSRILKMATSYDVPRPELISDEDILKIEEFEHGYHEHFRNFEFNRAADFIWQKIGALDQTIQSTEPFKRIKTEPEKARQEVTMLVQELWIIAALLKPFMPDTAERIQGAIREWKMPEPLFLRK